MEPERFIDLGFDCWFLQPMDGPRQAQNTAAAIDYIKRNPTWRLSTQTHKLNGIP
jgi:organic radical activating enzyme